MGEPAKGLLPFVNMTKTHCVNSIKFAPGLLLVSVPGT